MPSVMFVCLANTCRSPAAEGVLKHIADREGVDLHVESSGIGAWNVGLPPSDRMREATKKRGIHLTSRSQQFQPDYLDQFDLVLVADRGILDEVYRHAIKPHHKNKIHMITHFSDIYQDQSIPDPYYGGEAGFENVLDMIEDSCNGILKHLEKRQTE